MQPCSGVCFFMISSCCNIFCSNIIESTSCLVSEFIIKSTCCDENTFSIRKKCDKNWTEIKLINNLLCFLTEINYLQLEGKGVSVVITSKSDSWTTLSLLVLSISFVLSLCLFGWSKTKCTSETLYKLWGRIIHFWKKFYISCKRSVNWNGRGIGNKHAINNIYCMNIKKGG